MPTMPRSLTFVLVLASCASTGGTPDELPWVEPADPSPQIEAAAPVERPVQARVRLPEWIDARLDAAAVSLVGADDESIEILVGQFEHPEEAIVRFDRESGCASEVIGPWPTISKIVRGRAGFEGPRLGADELLAAAHDGALARELASVVPIYTLRGNTGEDKLQISNDGRHLVMEATDERLIASNDGGAHWQYLDGAFVGMPTIAPTGEVAIVRTCTKGKCGAPPSVASYRAALVRFDALPTTTLVSGPTLHDAVFARDGALVIARSDAFGRNEPTKICLESHATPDAKAKKLACVRTNMAGYWHMLSVSPDRSLAVIATTKAYDDVTLSIRSLRDGSEREAIAVPQTWEDYEWVDVMVSDAGVVAYRVGVESSVMGSGSKPGTMALAGGGTKQREVPSARPLGWIGNELVYLDRSAPLDPHGCGLVKLAPT